MLISAAVLRAADAPYAIEQVQLNGPGPDAAPQLFIPRLIDLWQQRRFPLDKLITSYPLSQINQAEADTTSGAAVKPVLIPDPLA